MAERGDPAGGMRCGRVLGIDGGTLGRLRGSLQLGRKPLGRLWGSLQRGNDGATCSWGDNFGARSGNFDSAALHLSRGRSPHEKK